ncbi:MAG TPA: SAF domain-containing protein [bacterium]|nr:SAF domain-containing protein [bacterium]
MRAAIAGSEADAVRLLGAGQTVIASRAEWLVGTAGIDVVVDATGIPDATARLALLAIERRVPFVTMTVEADVTVGPLLAQMARDAGVVYTVGAGDEPSVLFEMVEFARAIGLDVVCAGKGKNNRLDRSATPEGVEAEATARGMSARILTSFVDGTKTMVEMAALANATGLRPDRPGMHGPRADLRDLLRTFIPSAEGGVLRHRGAVDYAIGDVAPGVFLVVTSPRAPIRRDLAYLRMGEGPYYLLVRPYHLASLEVPLSVARAALSGDATMHSAGRAVAECVAVAKRDLRAGEVLDGIGGPMVYGTIDTAERAARSGAVPIGVTQGARLLRNVPRGVALTAADVALDDALTIVRLRRRQDALAGGAEAAS